MPVLVHIEGQVIIGKRLDSLLWRKILFHFNPELALELGLVDFAHVGGILGFVKLHILEVVLVLEVFIQSVLGFNAAKKKLYPVPLLV